jgi:RNA polymerase sigma-70 factor (TIGR02960 family)
MATTADDQAFRELTDPYRRELQLHCYRMLGSVQDAEDLVQETLLAAWRNLDSFEGRASVRTWLYRIATNRCLNALRTRSRRPRELPTMDAPAPTRQGDPVWLEPYPDALLDGIPDRAPGPEARYEARESVELAFTTAVQRLPARQRATLMLRDVLGFRAAEVAEMLDTSEVSVKSALQRARTTLDSERPAPDREHAPPLASAEERRLVERFADAVQAGAIDDIVAILTDDALLTMPPLPLEYQGREAIAEFLNYRMELRGGALRVVPTRANGQPALGGYLPDPTAGVAHPRGLIVLTLEGDAVSAITWFGDTSVFPYFGLPEAL